MNWLVLLIFSFTYVLIASRGLRILPIGRPAGALIGAVLMVAVGAISPQESYQAIDHNTIVLLFGMMLLTVYLERAGFFEWMAEKVISISKTPWRLLYMIAIIAGALSAFLVNDTVCLFLTPVVVATCRRAKLPMAPYLLAVATSSNIGSSATLVGNPQNMIIGSMSGYDFSLFLFHLAPAAIAGMVVNIFLLGVYYRKRLPKTLESAENGNERTLVDYAKLRVVLVVTGLVITGFFAGFHLGYTAVAGVTMLILSERKNPKEAFARVDWALLVFFCGLFIVVFALAKTGLVEAAWKFASPYINLRDASGLFLFSAFMLLGSNIVSNVPMVLLTGPHLGELGSPQLGWALLAFTTTVAGNFTLIGSVANIIVAETAKEHYVIGFREYFKFGFVSTILTLVVGVPLIILFQLIS